MVDVLGQDSKREQAREAMTLAAMAYCIDVECAVKDHLPNWKLVWEPVHDVGGNLAYIAQGPSQFVVAIRGSIVGFNRQTFENWTDDLKVLRQKEWEWPAQPSKPMISHGAYDGLHNLRELHDKGNVTMYEFLMKEAVDRGVEISVVGHSLGGNLTTVYAPWLHAEVSASGKTVPAMSTYTFAAPTAGNEAFVKLFRDTIGRSYRYWNVHDVVPRAWQDLPAIKNMFGTDPGPECPWWAKGAIDVFEGLLEASEWWQRSNYCHTNGDGDCLQASVSGHDDWFLEVAYQHNHNTYLSLLGAKPIKCKTSSVI